MVAGTLQSSTSQPYGLQLPPSVSPSSTLPVEHHQSLSSFSANGFQSSLAGALDMPASLAPSSLHSTSNDIADAGIQSQEHLSNIGSRGCAPIMERVPVNSGEIPHPFFVDDAEAVGGVS